MAEGNWTQVTEILLLGFPQGQPFLFLFFLAAYLVTLLGNTVILSLVLLDPHLRSPMYFFLSHLSFLDICYSTVTVPKVLANSLSPRAAISYRGCLAQIFFLMSCAGSESSLLAVMAYDRYVAIVHPLHYAQAMRRAARWAMAVGCWLWGVLDSVVHTVLASRLSFCGAIHLQHLFCDAPPLLRAACGNTQPTEVALHAASVFMGFGPFLLVVGSYLRILAAVLAMPAAASRHKAFSTCSAHLLVVLLFFVTGNLNYNRLGTDSSLLADSVVSALFCIVTPVLNPLIYSLRNQEVRAALRRVLGGRWGSWGCGADVGPLQ